MKLLFALSFALSLNAQAFEIKESVDVALFEVDTEIGKENVKAYKGTLIDDEVEVSVLTENSGTLTYGCHRHGPQIACHEEGHDHLAAVLKDLSLTTFDQMQAGSFAAILKFEKTLVQRGTNLAAISSYKVWTTPGTDDDDTLQEDHVDVWVRFDYHLNNSDKVVYVQCHEHGAGNLACHYQQTGNLEPQF